MHDYNARYYSAVLGRFVSPDSIVPEPGSSGGFNRYRYARNNPLKYTDSSGHFECEDHNDCSKGPNKEYVDRKKREAEKFTLSVYIISREDDPAFQKIQENAPAYDVDGNILGEYDKEFLDYYSGGVPMQGSGVAINEDQIRYVPGTADNPLFEFGGPVARYEDEVGIGVVPFETVATVDPRLHAGDVIRFPGLEDPRFQGEFTVTDTGGGLPLGHVDIFVGEMYLNDAYKLGASLEQGSRVEIISRLSSPTPRNDPRPSLAP